MVEYRDMNTPENRRGMTRREFIRHAAIILGAVGLAEGIAIGTIDHIEKNRRIKELEESSRQKDLEAALRQEELGASLYFERLKNIVLETQLGKDRGLELRRDIYFGNVNDFDRKKLNISRGTTIIYSVSGPETIVTIDATGKQTVETRGERKESTEVKFFIPDFITDITERKKSNIKILYLDSGANHPFKSRFEQAAGQVQDSVKKLLPQLDVNVAGQEVIPWGPNTQVYFNGVTGGIKEDTTQDGKFRLSDKYRYLVFAESPLQAYYGNFSKHADAGGSSVIQNNIAVVNLFNYKLDTANIITASLQEIGHSYGLGHCWEENCAMSYKVALGYNSQISPNSFGSRCSMIGTNIANGHIEEVRDPQKPKAYFASARLIPEDIARQDLEKHLIGYLSDIGGKIPPGLRTYSILGRDEDIVGFSMHNRNLATLSVNEFISTITTI